MRDPVGTGKVAVIPQIDDIALVVWPEGTVLDEDVASDGLLLLDSATLLLKLKMLLLVAVVRLAGLDPVGMLPGGAVGLAMVLVPLLKGKGAVGGMTVGIADTDSELVVPTAEVPTRDELSLAVSEVAVLEVLKLLLIKKVLLDPVVRV